MLIISDKNITVSAGDTFVIPVALVNHILKATDVATFTIRKVTSNSSLKTVVGEAVLTKQCRLADAREVKDEEGNTVGSLIFLKANASEALTAGNYLYDLVLNNTADNTQVQIIRPSVFKVIEVLKE